MLRLSTLCSSGLLPRVILSLSFPLFYFIFIFFYISLPLFRLNIPSRKLYLEKGRKRKEGKNCIALSVEKMRGINFCIYCIVRSIIGSKEYEEYDIFFILILTMRVLIALIRKRKYTKTHNNLNRYSCLFQLSRIHPPKVSYE